MNIALQKVIHELLSFVPLKNGPDSIWNFYIQYRHRWQYLHVQEYRGVYYFSGSDIESFSTDQERDLELKVQELIATLPTILRKIYSEVKRDSIAYRCRLNRKVSVFLRTGIIPRSFVHELIPEWKSFDSEMKSSEMTKTISLLSKHSESEFDEMTAQKYFDYCKIAYMANGKKSHKELNPRHSGFELYDRWADSRDGGLKKISRDSPKAFERWFDSKQWSGCHPWEIYRGGNSTHIDMAVTRASNKKSWKILLVAFSSSRLVETCRIALALHKAKLPFELQDRESYLLRLRKSDWIGIVPRHESLAYAWHDFPKEWPVADSMHFSFFKDDDGKSVLPLKKIRDLVTWFPLPVVRVKS